MLGKLCELLPVYHYEATPLPVVSPPSLELPFVGETMEQFARIRATKIANALRHTAMTVWSGLCMENLRASIQVADGKTPRITTSFPGSYSDVFHRLTVTQYKKEMIIAKLDEAIEKQPVTPPDELHFEQRNRLLTLLTKIGRTADPNRTARFVCHIVVARPNEGVVFHTTGECRGIIARCNNDRGPKNGYGFESIFRVTAFGERIMSEMPAHFREASGHQPDAIKKLVVGFLTRS